MSNFPGLGARLLSRSLDGLLFPQVDRLFVVQLRWTRVSYICLDLDLTLL
ncbi:MULTISPECIES: hypothetical protein [Streptomyces]